MKISKRILLSVTIFVASMETIIGTNQPSGPHTAPSKQGSDDETNKENSGAAVDKTRVQKAKEHLKIQAFITGKEERKTKSPEELEELKAKRRQERRSAFLRPPYIRS